MIDYVADGLMAQRFSEEAFQPEIYYRELKQYLHMIEIMSCKK